MKRLPIPVLVLCLSGALGLLAIWLFATSPGAQMERDREERRSNAAAAPAAAIPVVAVDALRLREDASSAGVAFSGILEGVRFVVVGAEVEGRVVGVPAIEHDPVNEGDPLVRLDPALPQAAVARARAALQRASAENDLATSALARQQNLTDRGVTSDAEFDRAYSEERMSASQAAEARAQLVEASTRLGKTEIVAPFGAIVSKLDLEPGAYLRAGDAVAELVDLSEIEVKVGVGDRQVLFLKPGQAASLSVDVYPGESFPGEVHRVGKAPDGETRKYPVPVRFPNPEARLLPGMVGTVRFALDDSETPSLRVPRRALQSEFELDYIYVLEVEPGSENGHGDTAVARRRRVETRPVAFRPDLVGIASGATANDLVAITGVRELREGLRVRVREEVDVTRDATP